MNDDTAQLLSESINNVAASIYRLGTAEASTPMGGLESLGAAILEAAEGLSKSICDVADAINGLGEEKP